MKEYVVPQQRKRKMNQNDQIARLELFPRLLISVPFHISMRDHLSSIKNAL